MQTKRRKMDYKKQNKIRKVKQQREEVLKKQSSTNESFESENDTVPLKWTNRNATNVSDLKNVNDIVLL